MGKRPQILQYLQFTSFLRLPGLLFIQLSNSTYWNSCPALSLNLQPFLRGRGEVGRDLVGSWLIIFTLTVQVTKPETHTHVQVFIFPSWDPFPVTSKLWSPISTPSPAMLAESAFLWRAQGSSLAASQWTPQSRFPWLPLPLLPSSRLCHPGWSWILLPE